MRIVTPPSQCVQLVYQLSSTKFKYYIDWGGALIWIEAYELTEQISPEYEYTYRYLNSGFNSGINENEIINIEENTSSAIGYLIIQPETETEPEAEPDPREPETTATAAETGAGNAFRSTLPAELSGMPDSGIQIVGTMNSGTVPVRCDWASAGRTESGE